MVAAAFQCGCAVVNLACGPDRHLRPASPILPPIRSTATLHYRTSRIATRTNARRPTPPLPACARRRRPLGLAGAGAVREQLRAGPRWVTALWLDDNALGPAAAAVLAEARGAAKERGGIAGAPRPEREEDAQREPRAEREGDRCVGKRRRGRAQ